MSDRTRKSILAMLLAGTAIEWMEFIYFIYIAKIVATAFFPPGQSEYVVYTLIASSYLARPVGALIFGYIGDLIGRKPAVILALSVMSLATLSIGVMPTYNQIGSIATLGVVVARIMQCLALPGEFTGAAVIILEDDKYKNSRYFYTSLVPFAASLGMVIGSAMAMIVSLEGTLGWAWRVPFLISAIVGIIALVFRTKLDETLIEKSVSPERNSTHRSILLPTIVVVSFAALVNVWVYIGNVFYRSILYVNVSDTFSSQAVTTFGQLLTTILIPYIAYLIDKRKCADKACSLAVQGAAVLAMPMLILAGYNSYIFWTIGQIIYALINALLSATLFVITFSKISKMYRYRASGVAWNLTSAVVGGSALHVGKYLHQELPFIGPGIYISMIAIITLIIFRVSQARGSHSYDSLPAST